MKITTFLLSSLFHASLPLQAANVFLITGYGANSAGNQTGTFNLPSFTTPNATPQETVQIANDTSAGRINYNLGNSNVTGGVLDPSKDPGAYLDFTVTGGGTVDIMVTEIVSNGNGVAYNPYRFEFITTGVVTDIEWRMQFNSSFVSLNSNDTRLYTIAQRTLVDPNNDGTIQNFDTVLRAYDENLAQYDLQTFSNLETPFIIPTDPNTGTYAIISHTDPNFSVLTDEFTLDGDLILAGTGNTLLEQVDANGWASTGNGIKSLDSTDRQANHFGAFEGSISVTNGTTTFEEGTVFAMTTNGTLTTNSVSIPEPTSILLLALGCLSFTTHRKRS